MSEALRVVVLSSLSTDSGSHLRASRLARALENAGAKVIFVQGISSLPFMLHYPITLLLYLRVLFISCDVVIGLKPLPNVGLVLFFKKLLGAVTVVDIDDVDFGYRTGPIATLNRILQLPTPKRCTLVTYHNDRLRPFIRETFAVSDDRLYQVSQGVDLSLCLPVVPGARSELRRWLGLDSYRLVAYTAHLNIASDLDAILDIIRIASGRMPDLRFLVIGGGPLARRFRRIARELGVDNVTMFTGYLPPAQVVEYLMIADAGIVYYKDIEVNCYRESMKLREMLALGLKVVCNDVGELRRFEDYTYQTSTDREAVAREILRVLETGGDGREARGMAYVRTHLDWNDIGVKLLHRLTEGRRVTAAESVKATAPRGLR